MELTQVEKERSGLVQFLVILIMIFLGIIMVLSWQENQGYAIPSIAVLSLVACLYAVIKERHLKQLHAQLVRDLIQKESQVRSLGRELKAEQAELAQQKGRTDQLGMQLQEVTGLYRAISQVNAVSHDDQIPDAVLRAALELVGGDCGSIMLLDERKENLVISCARGLDDHIVTRTRQRVGEGVAGWVARHGEPVLLTGDIQHDERFQNLTQRETDVYFSMSVPLNVRGTSVGVINIGSTDQASNERFSEYHLRFATIFGQHASVAIQNAQLNKILRQRGVLVESA